MDRGNIGLYDTLLASGSFWKASTIQHGKGKRDVHLAQHGVSQFKTGFFFLRYNSLTIR